MAGNTVVLLPAASVARHLGWWCPAADLLGRIGPGCEVKLRAGIAEEDGEVAVERTRAVWLSVDRVEERLLYGTVTESSFDALATVSRRRSTACSMSCSTTPTDDRF